MEPLFNTLSPNTLTKRREIVFLLLAGLFLGTLGIINILGLSRFVDLSFSFKGLSVPLIIPLGVLPYPITFLCTDIICEFYGKARANQVVWIGLFINLWILFVLWIGGILPPHVAIDPTTNLPATTDPDYSFYRIRLLTMGCVIGSMVAYLVAQLLDVRLFYFWKNITQGKHLWLRNNGSTLISQLVDTIIVTATAFYLTDALPISADDNAIKQLFILILYSYTFKAIIALLDTIPCYLAVYYISRYFSEQKNTIFSNQLISGNT